MSTAPESSSDLWLEHSNFLGSSLGCIAYGAFVILFFVTARRIIQKPAEGTQAQNCRAFNLIYIAVLFVVTTVNVAEEIRWTMLTFIDNRNYPGGPVAYAFLEVPELIIGNAAFVVSNVLTDGLVLYRCLVIWQDNYIVMAIPLLMFLASTATSIMALYQTTRPTANLWSTLTLNYVVPYWSLSISLNVIVTLLISGRLFMMRKRMREVLGPRHAKKYTSAIAMLVESAALFTGTGLIYLITYARNSYVQNLIWPIHSSVMPAAPLLILLRVASGDGFSRETTCSLSETTKLSEFFAPGSPVSSSRTISIRIPMDELTETYETDSRCPNTGVGVKP